MSDIIAAMGRMRIKKKAEVIPFPQTIAYRMMLIVASIVLFVIAIYRTFVSVRAADTYPLMVFIGLTLLGGVAVFYNMDKLRDARVPAATLKRMKRRQSS